MLYGYKYTQYDKAMKTIRFFNMFGELLQELKMAHLERVFFRPRPKDILKNDQIKKLKKDYKKKYDELFKNEETEEKKKVSDVKNEQRKNLRDDFLNNFYLPLR